MRIKITKRCSKGTRIKSLPKAYVRKRTWAPTKKQKIPKRKSWHIEHSEGTYNMLYIVESHAFPHAFRWRCMYLAVAICVKGPWADTRSAVKGRKRVVALLRIPVFLWLPVSLRHGSGAWSSSDLLREHPGVFPCDSIRCNRKWLHCH